MPAPVKTPTDPNARRMLDEAEKKWQAEAKLLRAVMEQTHKDVLTVQKLTPTQQTRKILGMATKMRECAAALSRIQQQF